MQLVLVKISRETFPPREVVEGKFIEEEVKEMTNEVLEKKAAKDINIGDRLSRT